MDDVLTPAPAAEAQRFLSISLDALLQAGESGDGSHQVLDLFRVTARDVPAYRQLLVEHKIDPAAVKSTADFARLPLLDKKNYNRRFSLDDLVLGGTLTRSDFFAVSSGSTGEPTFWPRAWPTNSRSPCASSRCSAMLSRHRRSARLPWSASRSAPGSAACSPRPACGISRPRAIRS
jgi:hypothetical protein